MRELKLRGIFFLIVGLMLTGQTARADESPTSAAKNWPQWRGPEFRGVAPAAKTPTEWSDTKNIKWKAAIPGKGHATPIIWGDNVFILTAIPAPDSSAPAATPQAPPAGGRRGGPGGGGMALVNHKFDVICLDRKTGKTLWQKTSIEATPHEGHHPQYGSFASASPVTDGERLYVSFGSRGLYCYDFDGKEIWKKDPGVKMQMLLAFGEGTSPTLYKDALFVRYDQQQGSFMVKLDKKTGEQIWRVDRDEQSSWATGFIIESPGRTELVVPATNATRSYDVATGELLWQCKGLGRNSIPTPVTIGGLVIVMTGYTNPALQAIKLGGKGDLTGTDAIVWGLGQSGGTPYSGSPILDGKNLFFVTDQGQASCYDAPSGTAHYARQRLPGGSFQFKTSPVQGGDKIYLASENGDVLVLKAGTTLEALATNHLDEVFIASPAIAGDDLFLRGDKHLYCIGQPEL